LPLDVPTRSFVDAAGVGATARAAELADLISAGGGSFDARVGEVELTTRTVFDTADRRLRRAGLGLVLEATEGPGTFVLDGPGGARPLRVASSPRRRRRYLVGDLPDGALAARLTGVVGVRALLPLVEIRRCGVPVDVVDHRAKTVVRMVVAELWAVPQDKSEPRSLRGRVEVKGVLGYRRPFAHVDAMLAGAPDLAVADVDVADEAVIALGGSPDGLSNDVTVALLGDEPAAAASRRILRGLADVVEANLPGTLDDLDSEFLHDLRIANRRSRAVLRQMKRTFDPVARREQADSLRWLQAVTGPVRDLDVQLLEWDELVAEVPEDRRAALEPAHALLVEQRAAALRTMKTALRSAEHRRRWTAWRLFLAVDAPGRPAATAAAADQRPIRKVVSRRIHALSARIVRDGATVTAETPAEALHDLRKRGKELRYVLELYGRALWPAPTVKPLVSALKTLQGVLGQHHDRAVQGQQLRALAPEMAHRPGGPEALLAMGSLIDRLESDQRRAWADIAEPLRDFAQVDLRGIR
jgi:CHAD domain-containing protein